MSDIDGILTERKSKYGDYRSNAKVTQDIMRALLGGENYPALNDMHIEGLHMIAHKMSRIVNGDPDYADSWYDIEGYAKCVRERIIPQVPPPREYAQERAEANGPEVEIVIHPLAPVPPRPQMKPLTDADGEVIL